MRWPWTKREPLQLAEKAQASLSQAFSGPVPPPTKPAGSDGVQAYYGYLVTGERNQRLIGINKWVTFDNITLDFAIVASAIQVWTNLGGSAKWSAVPNKHGGKDAQRGADIVTEGLLESQMSSPWRACVRRQLMKKFRGFAMHEMLIRRRADGMVVCGDLQHRPQWTIQRWDIPNEQTPWQAVEQWTRSGERYVIPRERLLYSVENTLSDTPDGVGLLRMLAEPCRILGLYQDLEGIGFQTDLRGMPYIRAPLKQLQADAKAAGAKTAAEIGAYVQTMTKFLTDFLVGHNKTPEQGMLVDSETYKSNDSAQTPSAVQKWALDLVKGATSAMPEVGTAIGRLTRDIARIMCAEWLLLGGEDSGGAYSMHEDKTAMFGLVVNSALQDVADDATRDCAARLIRLNGLDPETCTPQLVPDPVATASVESACRALQLLAQAGLHPQDKAPDILRGRMDLPPAPALDQSLWVLPRGAEVQPEGGKPTIPPGGAPAQAKPGAMPVGDDGQSGNVNAQPDKGK